MMAASTHVKLGLMTLLTVFALALVAYVLAIRRMPTDSYHTYFDESVQGLDRGAMVKFRGVRIGKVSHISIAPDHQLIDVEMAIDKGAVNLEQLGPRLRTQLIAFGITGVKLIDLDLATPDTPPPPALVFIAPKHYVASRPSLFDSLTRRLDTLSSRILTLVDRTLSTVDIAHALAGDAKQLTTDFRELVRHVDVTAGKLDKLIATAQDASESSRELVRTVSDATGGLDQTLHDVRNAARSFGLFFDALDREPDMLLKGRSRSHR